MKGWTKYVRMPRITRAATSDPIPVAGRAESTFAAAARTESAPYPVALGETGLDRFHLPKEPAEGKKFGLDSFMIVLINNGDSILFGKTTSATPDGRKAGKPISNGNQPGAGYDTEVIYDLHAANPAPVRRGAA